jgi:hypothetical protein
VSHWRGDRGYRFFTALFDTGFLFAVFFLPGRGGAERSTLGLSAHHIGLKQDDSENAISDDECPGWMNIELSPSVCGSLLIFADGRTEPRVGAKGSQLGIPRDGSGSIAGHSRFSNPA